MWKFSMFLKCFKLHVLFLLASSPSVNSKEILIPRQCAVCLEPRCATIVTRIWLKGNGDSILWKKQDEEIPQCFNDNLKSDKPCQVPNGNLVLRTANELEFESKNLASSDAKLISSVNMPCADLNLLSKPSPGMCAVCLDKDCATLVEKIYPAGSITTVWVKANSSTGIQNCSKENLKADAPCKMANGSLVQRANKMLRFDEMNPRVGRRTFDSQISPCADLNLPPRSTPSPACADLNLPSSSTLSPDNKGGGSGIVSGSINVSFIVIAIAIVIGVGVLIGKRKSRGQGQDKDHRHGNNKVPPHDAEDCDENTMGKQPLKGGVPNGTVNGVHREDDSVGPEGYLDDSPV